MDAGLKKSRKPNPRQNAFPLSAATFFYTIPTFIMGFKRDLEESDLAETLTEHKSSILGNKMEMYWKVEEERAAKRKTNPSLQRVLIKVFGLEFCLYGIVLTFTEVVRIIQPLVLAKLVRFYAPGQTEISQEGAYYYALGVVLCSLVYVVVSHPYAQGIFHLGMKLRVACCSLIYRKSLKLSKTSLGQTTAGQIVNLLSNDVNRFDNAALFAHLLWIGPVETVVCSYLMYLQIGFSITFGVLALIMYIPIQRQTEVLQEEAYYYAAGVVLCSLVNIMCSHPYMLAVLHLGMKLRVACCSLIYRKALKLSKTSLGETTAGQVVNLLSNDVNRFDVAVLFAHQLWVGPIETLVCTYFMYLQVGISATLGVLSLIMFIPIQIYLGKRISILRMRTALRTDERVRLMNEIISGIQVIKMYAWEKPFNHLVSLSRRYEIKSIRTTSYMRGILLSFIMYSTRMSIFVSILAYVLSGYEITAEKVFVLTSFYNILRQTMTVFFPQGISQVAEAKVSIRRLNNFMLYDETQVAKAIRKAEMLELQRNGEKEKDLSKSMNGVAGKSDLGIVLSNATAKWSEASTENTLTNINLKVSQDINSSGSKSTIKKYLELCR
ncbi:hypothetical protein JTB14_025356 [Gonioctena quinquepunctata]|nr:hypothetical protein JTB14_025356 [Gonioctena quinquepunctata]